jgi:NAD(P)H-hydrate epimerase
MVITINSSILKKVFPKRKKKVHKGDFGKLLIIGGSEKYTGAPALNALAALVSLKTGVDVVEVIAVKRAADIIASFSPNLITIPLKGKFLQPSHLKALLKESENKNAFVIGSGIGRNKKTFSLVNSFLQKIKIPGVIDADALHAINSKISLKNFILTPHSREFKVLTGITLSENLQQKIKQVQQAAKKLQTTILLKGPVDIISNNLQTAINKTGLPFMTVGGTGDILAGITGSLLAQGNSLFNSACAAAFINGKAAELTNKKTSLTATDLLEQIRKVVG